MAVGQNYLRPAKLRGPIGGFLAALGRLQRAATIAALRYQLADLFGD
jgi:hypothetical protein